MSDDSTPRPFPLPRQTPMERYKQLQLFEHKTVLPNLAAKAALFAPVRPGRRKKTWEWCPVPTWGLDNISVAYKLEQLNQHDLNVFLMLVSFAKRDGGDVASFTRYEALKFLRTNPDGRGYKRLDDHLDRLQTTLISIAIEGKEDGQSRKYVLKDTLVDRQRQEERQGLYIVDIGTSLQGFFGVDSWSLVNMAERLELGQNQWALAVHAFLAVNRSPVWLSWEQIAGLWGQGYESGLTQLKKDFKRRVIKVLLDMGFLKRVEERDTAIGLFTA